MAAKQSKTQRLFDLIAALLRNHRTGIALSQLPREVPGYWGEGTKRESITMSFERDKAELRSLGIEIGVVTDEKGNPIRYYIDPESFFMQRLSYVDEPGAVAGGSTFTPDELASMARGAHVLNQLGDRALAEQAYAGLRRLAHDLPVYRYFYPKELVREEEGIDSALLEQLGDAVQRRKRVTFRYHALEQPAPTERTVQPYGLAHIEGRWSLFALDDTANALRQFRLRRMSDVSVNAKSKGTPDFQVPEDFDLWALTQFKHDWELGAEEPEVIAVRFTGETGLTERARHHGNARSDQPDVREYSVRRREPFLRWVLALAGEAVIESPADAVEQYAALARTVAAVHQTAGVA